MMSLVQLQGSEKQVKWAEDIRNEYIEKLETFVELYEKKLRGEELDFNELGSLEAARWFIIRDDEKEKYEEVYASVWNEELEENYFNLKLGRGVKKRRETAEFRSKNRDAYKAYGELKAKALIEYAKSKMEKEFQNPSAKFWIEEKRVF